MKIELLTLPGCPGAESARALLRRILDPMGMSYTETVVHNAEEAERCGFLGSPSVRIDGIDLEPARRNDPPCFACRTYNHGGKRLCEIPESLLRTALAAALPRPEKEQVSTQVKDTMGLFTGSFQP